MRAKIRIHHNHTLILLHSWEKLSNSKTCSEVFYFTSTLDQRNETYLRQINILEIKLSCINKRKDSIFHTWVNLLNSQDNQLWKKALTSNVYFLTKIRSSVLACVFSVMVSCMLFYQEVFLKLPQKSLLKKDTLKDNNAFLPRMLFIRKFCYLKTRYCSFFTSFISLKWLYFHILPNYTYIYNYKNKIHHIYFIPCRYDNN